MRFLIISLAVVLWLGGCTTAQQVETKETEKLVLVPAAFSNLPGWDEENFDDFVRAFEKSCNVFQKNHL